MRARSLSIVAAFLSFGTAHAQPSDQQILKDIASPKQLKVELTKGTTKKVWSDAHTQWFWERGATIWLPADIPEYPNARVVVYGFARYHTTVPPSYREWKTSYNTYEGIPTPSNEEVLVHVRANLSEFLGSYNYNRIVGEIRGLRVADEPNTEWHEPKSFSMNFQYEADFITSNVAVTTQTKVVRTRFYRDAVNAPWNPNMITQEKSSVDGTAKTYNADDLRAMPTLGSMEAEKQAQAELAALGDAEIPDFESDMDVFMHTHRLMREGDAKKFEAYLTRMLAPVFYVEGSGTRLTPQGAEIVNKAVAAAFHGKSTYAEQYCEDPAIKHHQQDAIELWNATQDMKTRMHVGLYGGGWKNGQKVGEQYRFIALEVWMWEDADHIARIRSYEPGMLCKPKGAVEKAADKVSPSGTGSSSGTSSQQSGGSDLMKKGKGLLNKLTTP